ncbi:MAG: RNA methyltransferase [Nitrospirae bacterium]|nr:MAG: RNA methyltransferase [Nitrospirota bacterium]
MKRVTSGENPTVKRFLKVIGRPERSAPAQGQMEGIALAEGPRVLEMALRAGIRPTHALVTAEFASRRENSLLVDTLLDRGTYVVVVEGKALKRLSQTVTPQGIIALCRVKASALSPLPEEPVVCVDGVQDPGNMGTIIRVVDAAGFSRVVVLKGSVNPYNPKSIRASAGSIFNVEISFGEVEEVVEIANSEGRVVVGTDLKGDMDLYEYMPAGRELVVFGNETAGISQAIRAQAKVLLRIPLYGKAESLNVAASAAVLLYEWRRRMQGAKP